MAAGPRMPVPVLQWTMLTSQPGHPVLTCPDKAEGLFGCALQQIRRQYSVNAKVASRASSTPTVDGLDRRNGTAGHSVHRPGNISHVAQLHRDLGHLAEP